ncbi:uncharacterized protein LOC117646367 [Thrips palmi]|uniref:Uncharacterized protein LOC117646367 n=1 Tax=Thrips palmi TaxID=161013 RepID=A0A6P8Z883_THRPL|nr:uncharacterized protein LOC117646367 [Thrips palmi]
MLLERANSYVLVTESNNSKANVSIVSMLWFKPKINTTRVCSDKMDPLTVLPVELVRMLVQLLAPRDLLALSTMSRAWRLAVKDPALWDAVRLRFPGDHPGLLRFAPAIADLELVVADLKPRHLDALLAGNAAIQRLTCLPSGGGAAGQEEKGANAATLVRILQRVSQSLRGLSVLCYVEEHSLVSATRERVLQIIVAMPRLRELRMGDMNFALDRYPKRPPVPVPVQGTLEKLCVEGEPRDCWAKTVLNLLRAHRTSLRSLELHEIEPMDGKVVASIAACRELRSLTLKLPAGPFKMNLMSAYKNHTRRIYRQLPKELTHLEHLKLLLPCPFDVDSSAHTDDGEGTGLDELAAGLRKHGGGLQSVELVVLCGSATRESRVEANEARLRAALPDTAVVKARVEKSHCHCTDDTEDDYENDYDDMVDAFYEASSRDASSYYSSDEEGDDD